MKEINSLIPQITAVVKQMAQALGVAAEHLYAVLIRQMFAEGVSGLVLDALWVIVLAVATFWICRGVKWCVEHDEFDPMPLLVMAAVVIVIVGSFTGYDVRDNTMKVANPEYYAIERVIDKVSPNK